MTPSECVKLTRLIQNICPAQKLDEYTSDAWFPLLDDIAIGDALDAMNRLGRRQPFIAPHDIRAEVKVIRRERVDKADATFVPTCDPDDTAAYNRQLLAHRRAIGDGAIEPTQPQLTRAVRPSLLARVFRRVPKAIEAPKPLRSAPTLDPDVMAQARAEIAQLAKTIADKEGGSA